MKSSAMLILYLMETYETEAQFVAEAQEYFTHNCL